MSSNAQSYECASKVLAMLFVAVMCDVVGRKPALLLGLTCCSLSVLLFVVATLSEQWLACKLFLAGQGLQGAFPMELLTTIIATDISHEPGESAAEIGECNMIVAVLNVVMVEMLGLVLNSLDLVDYFPVWGAMFVLNATMLLVAIRYVRDTKPAALESEAVEVGIVRAVRNEVQEYGRVLRDIPLMRLLQLSFILQVAGTSMGSTDFSFFMSYHEVSQAQASKIFWVKLPLSILLLGVTPLVIKLLGERRAWLAMLAPYFILEIGSQPFLLSNMWVMPVVQYVQCYMSSYGGFEYAVDSKYFDSRLTTKFFSMRKLSEYFMGIVALPMYAMLFDSKAEGYLRRSLPRFVGAGFRLAQVVVLWLCWNREEGGISQNLVALTKEREEREAREAAEASKKETEAKKLD